MSILHEILNVSHFVVSCVKPIVSDLCTLLYPNVMQKVMSKYWSLICISMFCSNQIGFYIDVTWNHLLRKNLPQMRDTQLLCQLAFQTLISPKIYQSCCQTLTQRKKLRKVSSFDAAYNSRWVKLHLIKLAIWT